mgnify:CR=1 FL=1
MLDATGDRVEQDMAAFFLKAHVAEVARAQPCSFVCQAGLDICISDSCVNRVIAPCAGVSGLPVVACIKPSLHVGGCQPEGKTGAKFRMRGPGRDGDAGAAVSAGNTGALMAMAKLALRTMPGIDRPALAALLPSLGDNDFVMLDLGANTECDARNLVEFAIMGAAYSRIALGIAQPRVALLNIGTEDQKGTDEIRDAAAILRDSAHLPMAFGGFIEGDKIARGLTDVVVCDGFSGNISLKTMEGTARFVTDLLRRAFTSSLRSKFGFLISRPATELMRHHLDPNNHNGAVFLGLNGVVVKSHGSASAKGVANAIGVAAKLVEANITQRITDDLAVIRANGQ